MHNAQALDELINSDDCAQSFYGVAAYIDQEASINKCKIVDLIYENGRSSQKLTENQKAN